MSFFVALALLASAPDEYLAPLSEVEVDALVEGLVVQQMCVGSITDGSRSYLRELRFKASQNNPEFAKWARGVDDGTLGESVRTGIVASEETCRTKLPDAFVKAELLKKIAAHPRKARTLADIEQELMAEAPDK